MTPFRILTLFISLSYVGVLHTAFALPGIPTRDPWAQVILDAFTSGIFGESPSPSATPQIILPYPTNSFPEETLLPIMPSASEEVLPTDVLSSLQPTAEGSPEETFSESPEQSSSEEPDASVFPEQSSDLVSIATPYYTPEVTSAPTAEEHFDQFSEEESGALDGVVTVVTPIRVNCGSFDGRNTFSNDTRQWFNTNSIAVEDPFAAAQFSSLSDTLLYTTYRTSSTNLTYTVPLEVEGVWRVTLHWAEIAPRFMSEGARVFTVYINGREVDGAVDVYRDAPLGGYSPMIRTYVINAYDSVMHILLGQTVGEPILSAFQINYISPFTAL